MGGRKIQMALASLYGSLSQVVIVDCINHIICGVLVRNKFFFFMFLTQPCLHEPI